ncbi:AraC family transcriptional regulator [Caballeronia sp. S22]|uniref:AraC family transcriptional regulator n=1 Tax=Caballeronia sp. S22 TaxID=3137182 RepID=UPI00353179D3
MDAVSDVLSMVHLRGAVYLNATFTAPWCVIGRPVAALCAAYLPQCERVVSYHLITDGSCQAQLAGDPCSAIQLNAGELLVVPQGEMHLMGSSLDVTPAPVELLLSHLIAIAPGEVMTLSHGDGGTPTRMVCGFLACDDTLNNPLLSSLPRIFKIDLRNEPRAAWLEASLRFATAEAAESRVGGTIVLGRLSELLFVESVRCCIEALPEEQTGWLAGVRDRFVGRALSLLHAQPLYSWTVDELARRVGLSRSALGHRFTHLLGRPPMQYLARWRLQIAAQELLIQGKSLATVAEQVGYESEAAFSRAFKREFGMPPAGWRKNQQGECTAPPS